jgi:hypothetical protein
MTLRIDHRIILNVAMLPEFLDQSRNRVRSVQLSQFIATIWMAMHIGLPIRSASAIAACKTARSPAKVSVRVGSS